MKTEFDLDVYGPLNAITTSKIKILNKKIKITFSHQLESNFLLFADESEIKEFANALLNLLNIDKNIS